ncbi:zinc finger protein 180-like [Boleophthalmus pectinirostris]|uniref:zinc finger protein 180-like n=1 Tax=Boleophthalmus pectinirostris TaxID=150288 RepID=UPI0024318B77|nr:zinc finger protein 180-like [Boleophthalmus pectinirostris]
MSEGFRAFVEERLGADAEGICALFQNIVADYEEELRCTQLENQKIQRLLDSALRALSPRVVLVTAAVHLPSPSPDLTPQIKEEPSIKQEDNQLQVSVPEFSAVSVKTEESSLLQQRQTEQREDIQGEDISAETHVHLETEGETGHSSDTDSDEDWRAPLNCSPAHMDTGADEDHRNQDQARGRSTTAQNPRLSPKSKSTPETRATVDNGDMSGTGKGAESRKHKCSVCKKRFVSKYKLQKHRRVHTGEKPFSCSVCKKVFAVSSTLKTHMRTHTGEKPFSCSVCKKEFAVRSTLKRHMRTHTGEKPFSCSVCKKEFAVNSALKTHTRTHTGEKPFSCSVCKKVFAVSSTLKTHMRTHTGEKPFSCSVCKKEFAVRSTLKRHMRTHTGEKPFSCSVCKKEFAVNSALKTHTRTHTGETIQLLSL